MWRACGLVRHPAKPDRTMPDRAHAWILVALAVLGASAGCDDRRPTGNVSLTVTVPSDVLVTEVDYQLTGIGIPETTGSIRVPEPSTMFSKLISHVPAGSDSLAHATAKSVDGMTECDGMVGAKVRPEATTVVGITLTCHASGGGQIHISIGVVCPWFQVTSYTASPLVASVGGTISVTETTSDTDGAPILYQWSAPNGTFESPTDSATTYTCTQAGAIMLMAGASTGPCQATQPIAVTCLGDDAAVD
jgi:hypothetical protein